MQIAATPHLPPVCLSPFTSVPRMRAPDAPSGCPMAIAPPNALTFSGSTGQLFTHASDCAAKASLSSTRSTSSHVMPARFRAMFAASTGPIPKMSGSTACVPRPAIRASGVPAFSLPISTAAAPSLSGEALPAVTVPSLTKAGLSLASFSSEESARMPSSRVSSVPGTGTTQPS